ncbi:hypothetical protein CROQUDRAFT_105904 [Cronartium quercuum f. sp. fusiforme G11]|uniref:Uncharacterized protein n=1 Tax=Cronartium quercuum f. sp. fusiforme G11 TaxID=708437 RepID=A0A9P6NRC6_9BASI|nr:hypothetical protein CROQUDRAFT_105904 [Cronartium quercuum f. sp. fusiforme G11]
MPMVKPNQACGTGENEIHQSIINEGGIVKARHRPPSLWFDQIDKALNRLPTTSVSPDDRFDELWVAERGADEAALEGLCFNLTENHTSQPVLSSSPKLDHSKSDITYYILGLRAFNVSTAGYIRAHIDVRYKSERVRAEKPSESSIEVIHVIRKSKQQIEAQPSQSKDLSMQNVLEMMSMFMDTIKEFRAELATIKDLKEEIRALKAETSSPPTSGVNVPQGHSLPPKPATWATMPCMLTTRPQLPNMPTQPLTNAKTNQFKSASLIIHKSPNKEPFKGRST